MFCKKCGAKLPDGAVFCGHCGTKVSSIVKKPDVSTDHSSEVKKPDVSTNHSSEVKKPDESPDYASDVENDIQNGLLQNADSIINEERISNPDPTRYTEPEQTASPDKVMPWEIPVKETAGRKSGANKFSGQSGAGASAAPWKWLAIAMVIILVAVVALGFSYIKFISKSKAPAAASTEEEKSLKKTENGSASKKSVSKNKSSKKSKTKKNKDDNKKDKDAPDAEVSLSGSETPEQVMDDENGVFLPDSSSTALTDDDLSTLNPQQLTYARNEIYARHGAIFKSQELNSYFQGKTWYHATTQVSDVHLSDIELQNASKILDYQKANNKDYSPK